MKRIILLKAVKYFFIIFFISFLIFNTVYAKDSIDSLMKSAVYDSSTIEVRNPDESTLNKFRSDKDFQYDRAEAPLSFWDKIRIWINNHLKDLLSSEGFSIYFKYLLYLIVAVAVFIVIYVLLKSNIRGIFYGKQRESINKFKIIEEDIEKIDFDKRILEAVNNQNFRLAVRLYYLKILKQLSDKKIIDWQINKTNSSYVKEVKKINLHNQFEKITTVFEWIWYGEFPIDGTSFVKIKDIFIDFDNNVEQSK